jgi:hypothetical protein
MAKAKAKKQEEVTPQPNGATPPSFPPYMMPHLLAERMWNHMPAYFAALKTLHEEQTKTNVLLMEIRDALKEK